MVKRKVRRSNDSMRRKMRYFWIISLFFLCLLTLLDAVVIISNYSKRKTLDSEVDYSQISLEGIWLNQELPEEARQNIIIDAVYSYSWNNVSIAIDKSGYINRLAFFTTNSDDQENVKISDIELKYRGRPLETISDFVNYFGFTKVTNFGHYKYLTYADEHYGIDVTLMDNVLYNVELYRK